LLESSFPLESFSIITLTYNFSLHKNYIFIQVADNLLIFEPYAFLFVYFQRFALSLVILTTSIDVLAFLQEPIVLLPFLPYFLNFTHIFIATLHMLSFIFTLAISFIL
jgi:hypothetical protein